MKTLLVFDIDGTICDSREAEGVCFAEAIQEVTGFSLATLDWTQYPEPTSAAIVRDVLARLQDPEPGQTELRIVDLFVQKLSLAALAFPAEFSPLPGAPEFIRLLQQDERFVIGFATGCYEAEASFKLKCCGIEMKQFPFATSSDFPARRQILPLVIRQAGFDTNSAVYFGDGAWDIKVSRGLGIPMIGIGRRRAMLLGEGIPHVFSDYQDPDAILKALGEYQLVAAKSK